jgi:hypothetical protein
LDHRKWNEIALRLATRLFDQRLIQNQYRSAYVEAMIEPYLQSDGWRYVGDDWRGWDFERGKRLEDRLEVKQSAAHQTWSETDNVRTRGIFDIAARTGYFSGSKFTPISGRCAGTYVFAWNPVYGADTDHRDPDQWEFYVVSAAVLPEGQRTIGMSKIRRLTAPSKIIDLAAKCRVGPNK